MGRVIEKFGLYTQHLGDFISREKNNKNRATAQCKLNKLLEAQVILCSAFLRDMLTPARVFTKHHRNSRVCRENEERVQKVPSKQRFSV